jgi:phage anti-repressor protein
MTDLIQINKTKINGAEVNSVNLRDLHNKLKSKRQFADYAKGRLERFTKDLDWISISQKSDLGNKPKIEYYISLDCAKMIAMMENNEIGDKIRKYFVEVEKKKSILPSAKELALMVVKAEEEKELLQIENKKKNEFISNVVHSENSYTATQVAKDFNISAKLFNKILVEANVLYYQNGTYALTSRYQSYNLTTIKETSPDAYDKTYLSLRWTVTGKNWLKTNWNKAIQRCSKETFDLYNMSFLKNIPAVPMPKKSDRNF